MRRSQQPEKSNDERSNDMDETDAKKDSGKSIDDDFES